jgi:phosphoglycerate dehydrogenase-like enzyme
VFRIDEFETVISSNSEEDQIDALVLCVPGTSDSEGLLSAERIAVLPEKAFVINVGRGTVIDQETLIEALNDGRIAGAALDVMYPEPLPADHPLWTARNCIITPHISGDMGLPETIDITVNIFCENLKRYAEGKELTNLIDVNAGY